MTFLRLLAVLLIATAAHAEVILFADYSDPDVVRVGGDYYLVSSSFQHVPGLPILHSRDLKSWTIVGHAVDRLPSPDFDRPQHGNGIWAPSIRHHDGWFWIYFGDPDRGIFMTRARDARGPWEPLTLVHAAKGWIDPCPLWDDDGRMYLVHAWAKSRAGFNGVLHVNELSADGRRVVDEGVMVFDGSEQHPTIEGPKFYKRNGWYYIFAPAGGVKRGWQTVLRAKSVLGPYEAKIVLEQRGTSINGPHQGAWVTGPHGDSFVHFQDRGAYGRVVHRQSLQWVNDWPEIDGPGEEPVAPSLQQTSDDFDTRRLGLQWQWQGNPPKDAYTLRGGRLRLSNVPANLWNATNLLLQKFPAPAFAATAVIDPSPLKRGERAGLVVFGLDYSALVVQRTERGLIVRRVTARNADRGGAETELGVAPAGDGPLQLRVTVSPEAVARFSYKTTGDFQPLGSAFVARPGKWVGAKVGVFGRADFDEFRVERHAPADAAGLVVAQDGSGDFRSIQEAIDAIPASNEDNQTILIRNGTYAEKVMIDRSFVTLVGEDRDKTRIEYAELRRNWRATHPDDWGAAVINIRDGATDVTIANLTVHNNYGSKHGDHDHQFAIRTMGLSNRIAVLHANVIADGGDTFSPWNSDSGLTYATDSYFEGYVDFVCPRGWAYITNSRFFAQPSSAGIWHDGSKNEDQKFVIRHSSFDGAPNFNLGRNHRDAQFYLLDVDFSATMADRPIYPADAPDPRAFGERYYYASARRTAGDFPWFADNLRTAAGSPRDEDVDARWTFGGRWCPASLPAVLPFAAMPRPENGWRFVDPSGVTLRWTPSRNAGIQRITFDGKTADVHESRFATGPLEPGKTYSWRVDTVSNGGVISGPQWTFRADPRTTRIALVGDSTVTEKQGWGGGFKAQLEESAALLNVARGGRSSKSFRSEGHWDELLRRKPTHVLLQFGHNDEPGKGLERETDVPTFRANMIRYVDEARAAGAQPVLVTSLARRYDDAHLGNYAAATRDVAREKNVPLIDLHERSKVLYGDLATAGQAAISPLKADGTLDRTHLNDEGSALFGAMMADELRVAVPQLAAHIRPFRRKKTNGAWSVRMADAEMKRTPDAIMLDARERPRWEYTPGLVLKAVMHVAERTGDERYWNYVLRYYDHFVKDDGSIETYKKDEYNIDRINPGKPLFALYARTKNEKYRKAIELLRQQMREHPRTKEGGFWHKKRYPYQMWLDGLYMGAPFLAQYAKTFQEPALFDDVINQFVWMEKHARDARSGLLYHGWDESRQQKWSDPQAGTSPEFWGRAMGWYAMGLVETLEFIPVTHPRRGELIAILQRLAAAVIRVQDPKSAVWWQVLDKGGREGNYLEASVSAMFSFSLMKAARLRYIDARYGDAGRRAYDGIVKQFISVDDEGTLSINQVCEVAGLGGDPEKGEKYRSGTFDYYVTEKIRSNDPKGVGPFIFASMEYERRGAQP